MKYQISSGRFCFFLQKVIKTAKNHADDPFFTVTVAGYCDIVDTVWSICLPDKLRNYHISAGPDTQHYM